MLGMLMEAFPQLIPILDFTKTEVLHLDTTFIFRLPHQSDVQPMLDYLANVSYGHRKATKCRYDNYIRWGNDKAQIRPKAYGKFEEVKSQLNKIQKSADKGCMRSKSLVMAMHDVLPFANALLRLEARICKTYMTRNGFPSNLFQLIKLQHEQPELLLRLWHVAFDPILKQLEGKYMNFSHDGELEDLLKAKLVTYTKKGNPSYVRAYNALDFYRSLQTDGWKKVMARHCKTRFYKRKDDLLACGFTVAQLQNLHTKQNGKVIPFVRLLELKMCDQLPSDYVQPVSPYSPKKQGLYLVA